MPTSSQCPSLQDLIKNQRKTASRRELRGTQTCTPASSSKPLGQLQEQAGCNRLSCHPKATVTKLDGSVQSPHHNLTLPSWPQVLGHTIITTSLLWLQEKFQKKANMALSYPIPKDREETILKTWRRQNICQVL